MVPNGAMSVNKTKTNEENNMNEIGEIIFSLILLGWAANTVYFVVGWARGEIVFRPKNTDWYLDLIEEITKE